MLNKENVLFWNEIQKDLYMEEDGKTFGVELDLLNNHINFYIRYPNKTEQPICTTNIYHAIDVFNGKRGLDCNTFKPM